MIPGPSRIFAQLTQSLPLLRIPGALTPNPGPIPPSFPGPGSPLANPGQAAFRACRSLSSPLAASPLRGPNQPRKAPPPGERQLSPGRPTSADSRGSRAASPGRRRPLVEPLRSPRSAQSGLARATPLSAEALQNINNKEGKKEKKPSFPNSQINFSKGCGGKICFEAYSNFGEGPAGSSAWPGRPVRARGQARRGAHAGGAGSPPAGGRRRHYLTWSRRLIPAQGYEAHQ